MNRSITEIVAEKMNLISKGGGGGHGYSENRPEKQASQEQTPPHDDHYGALTDTADDLPF